jgi:cell division protein FtsB
MVMNANELADWIEKSAYGEYDSAKQAATMLRQQQAEIDALKAENERLFASMLTMALDEEVRKAQER